MGRSDKFSAACDTLPRAAVAAVAVSLAIGAGGWSAGAAEPYYAGKTVSVIMGLGPSSGGRPPHSGPLEDTSAR